MSLHLSQNDITKALTNAINSQGSGCILAKRPICVQDVDGCINAFAILNVDKESTNLLRIELSDGTIILNPTIVECTCDCLDVCADCVYYAAFPDFSDDSEFILGRASLGVYNGDLVTLNKNFTTAVNNLAKVNNLSKLTSLVTLTDNGLLFTITGCSLNPFNIQLKRLNSTIDGCDNCGFETSTFTIENYSSWGNGFIVADFFTSSDTITGQSSLSDIYDIVLGLFYDVDIKYESLEVSGDINGDVTITICTPAETINSWISSNLEAGEWFIVLNNGEDNLFTFETSGECTDFVSTCPCDSCTYTASTLIKTDGDIFFNDQVLYTWDGNGSALSDAFLAALTPFYTSYGLAAPTVEVIFTSLSGEDGALLVSFTGCKLPDSVLGLPQFSIYAFKTFRTARFYSSCNPCDCMWTVIIPDFGSYPQIIFNIEGFLTPDLQVETSLLDIQQQIELALNVVGIDFNGVSVSGAVYDGAWGGDLTISVCTADENFFSLPDGEGSAYLYATDGEVTSEYFTFTRDANDCDCGPYCLYEFNSGDNFSLVGLALKINGTTIWTFSSGDFDDMGFLKEAVGQSILPSIEAALSDFNIVVFPDWFDCNIDGNACLHNIAIFARNHDSSHSIYVAFTACDVPGVDVTQPVVLTLNDGESDIATINIETINCRNIINLISD